MTLFVSERIEEIESRFKEVSKIDTDLSVYPLSRQDNLQVKTRKSKSKAHGEVFTPLWLVDQMIEKVDDSKFQEIGSTLDLCAGYGQFTIRLIRKYYSIHGESFDLDLFFERHWVSELQKSSAYKLLYIFGKDLNIAMGDSKLLNELPSKAIGVYYYSSVQKKWISKRAKSLKMDLNDFKNHFEKLEKEGC